MDLDHVATLARLLVRLLEEAGELIGWHVGHFLVAAASLAGELDLDPPDPVATLDHLLGHNLEEAGDLLARWGSTVLVGRENAGDLFLGTGRTRAGRAGSSRFLDVVVPHWQLVVWFADRLVPGPVLSGAFSGTVPGPVAPDALFHSGALDLAPVARPYEVVWVRLSLLVLDACWALVLVPGPVRELAKMAAIPGLEAAGARFQPLVLGVAPGARLCPGRREQELLALQQDWALQLALQQDLGRISWHRDLDHLALQHEWGLWRWGRLLWPGRIPAFG